MAAKNTRNNVRNMYDSIRCKMPLPDGREASEIEFQTKSIWCSLDLFTITAAGRLVYHRRRYEAEGTGDSFTFGRMVAAGDADMEYHGDVLIHGTTTAGASLDFVVRFTHGMVEWIRPLDSLPEMHRTWLLDRGQ